MLFSQISEGETALPVTRGKEDCRNFMKLKVGAFSTHTGQKGSTPRGYPPDLHRRHNGTACGWQATNVISYLTLLRKRPPDICLCLCAMSGMRKSKECRPDVQAEHCGSSFIHLHPFTLIPIILLTTLLYLRSTAILTMLLVSVYLYVTTL